MNNMATCGHCKATNVTVGHVRTCGQAGSAVATKQLPELVPGNVVTLADLEGYYLVTHVQHDDPAAVVEEIRKAGTAIRNFETPLTAVEMVFPSAQAATDYDLVVRTEATLRRNRETLHGDPDYCRGCAKGWAGAKWHRPDCPRLQAVVDAARAEGNRHDDAVPVEQRQDAWAAVNKLRVQVKAHLHRKVRNARVGHFALRAPADEGGMVKFYRVKLITDGGWTGKVFVDAQASDEFWPVRNPDALAWILGGILLGPRAAETLYGTELGKCYRCNRTLTDETSRALGIGPECRSKL